MSNTDEVQPLLTEPVAEPLIEPAAQPVPDTSVPIPEGYVDDEKGKMNTIEVSLVHWFYFQFCVNLMKGIAGTGSLALPIAFSQVRISDFFLSLGWYYSWYWFICFGVWYDDFSHISTR